MKYLFLAIFICISLFNLNAQMSIEEINHRLDTRPYFSLGLDYNMTIFLPDSIQEKYAKALNREIPENVLDSLSVLSYQYKEQELRKFKRECKEDSLCIQNKYNELIKKEKENTRKQYANDIMPNILILTAANWQVKKAIPVLKKAIGDSKYDQPSVLMALAKLGNDSAKQILIKRYTLPYILQTTSLDTINDYNLNLEDKNCVNILYEGMGVAMYLKNKEILLNLTDLIYIRGRDDMNIAESFTVSWFISDFDNYNYFHTFPNFNILRQVCYNYASAIWDLDNRKLNKKQKKELERLLSTEYRTKIRNQLREWIIKNVNFE
jgi:hypothetical protein